MHWIWSQTGNRVVNDSQTIKERQHLVHHLQYKEYKVGDPIGYPGRERTIQTIKQNYQWAGLIDSVKASCTTV
jgi:hypothetical protein